ncbi:MAG: hypothetical protein HKL96_12485 [Phycisphaerales bacterium]|nr:hypothetical protein [Phycisphaerales bacterium]
MKLKVISAIAAAATFATGIHLAAATNYNFNTTTGDLTVTGGPATGGTLISQATSQGEVFSFSGNVTFNTGDTISVVGSRPLIIDSYNDLTLGTNVTINVSANGRLSGPGGGDGGYGSSGGYGGAGGLPPSGANANNGGAGGGGGGSIQDGGNGSPGGSGAAYAGSAGLPGTIGNAGGAGGISFGSPINGALGGAGGSNLGQGGAVGLSGNPGSGGSGGASNLNVYSGSYGGGGGGGKPGYAGIFGASGTPGANGTNIAVPSGLTGGAGGGGGGGGQGGGGGGTGGVGGGAGGGGGGGGSIFAGGGNGGNGGAGGLGGAGGNGGNGGTGGNGGGGGGAVELYALGQLTVNGSIIAAGAAGQSGTAGAIGGLGSSGGNGVAGQPGGSPASASQSGYGGVGGNGGNGGTGGNGGSGGIGGNGGAGAGGTVELIGSTVNAQYGSYLTVGGTFFNNTGGINNLSETNGRFIVETNSQISPIPSVVGGLPFYFGNGPEGVNPFIQGPVSTLTPNIADLAGGVAAPYGVLANLQADSPVFAGLAKGAPANSLAAVLLGSSGLPGYSDVFPGYQWIFVVNLSGKAINGLKIGLSSTSSTFASAILQQTLSAGSGGFNIATSSGIPLPGNDVYAFLAPTSLIDSGTLFATATGAGTLTLTSDYGLVTPGVLPVGYLSAVATPEPATWMIALAAIAGMTLLPRRSRLKP